MRVHDSLPQAKFCKNRLRGYTPFKQIYTKKYQIWRFWGLYQSWTRIGFIHGSDWIRLDLIGLDWVDLWEELHVLDMNWVR